MNELRAEITKILGVRVEPGDPSDYRTAFKDINRLGRPTNAELKQIILVLLEHVDRIEKNTSL